jgi:hypothetical protein
VFGFAFSDLICIFPDSVFPCLKRSEKPLVGSKVSPGSAGTVSNSEEMFIAADDSLQ